jgi:sugar/nucleoside kinase (ribokinase family)
MTDPADPSPTVPDSTTIPSHRGSGSAPDSESEGSGTEREGSDRGIAIVGCTNVDVLVRHVDELPPPGTDNTVEEVSVRAAGPTMNVAFVVHALGDGPAVCFGAVGDDALGRLVLDECAARDVPTDGITRLAGERTGVSVALESHTRPRAFLTDLAAAARFDETMLPGSFRGFSDVVIGGYFVAPGLRGEATIRLLRSARADGARTWLDSGWDTDSWTTGGDREILAMLPEVDFFVPNEDEVRALTGKPDPVDGGRDLARKTRRGVILKVGADGAWWIPREGDAVHIPAPATHVVDTTGAGDALNAGVIVGLRRGLTIQDSVTLGVHAASRIVGRTSAHRWDPLPLS